jgi:hypothetical protein
MTSHVRQLVRSIHYRAFDFGAKDALCHKSIDIRRHSKKPMHNASRCKGALTELSPEFSNKGREQKKKKTYSAASRTSHLPTPVDYHVNYTVCIYTIMIYKRSVLPRSGESFFFSIPFRLCSNVFSSLTHTHSPTL